MGFKARALPVSNTTKTIGGTDDPTTFPRSIGLCVKQSATAPTTNAAGDNPTGIGDICLQMKVASGNATSPGLRYDVAQVDVFRCTSYVNSSTFAWAQIV